MRREKEEFEQKGKCRVAPCVKAKVYKVKAENENEGKVQKLCYRNNTYLFKIIRVVWNLAVVTRGAKFNQELFYNFFSPCKLIFRHGLNLDGILLPDMWDLTALCKQQWDRTIFFPVHLENVTCRAIILRSNQWMLEDRLGGAGIVEKKEEEAGAGAAEKKKEEAGAVEKKELAGTVEKKELTGPMEKKEVGPAVWIVGERMEAAAAA
ncbi:hypothetical protein SERLA73DRAFT_150251 [Serpula lacrymans var. lacrymans S7.3]|uniref:Uncharacterized protein n=1 Tax=Serpula lacrymans var. lacrymans (strain S7.3) TaxID=936435 RepID=F8PLR7_SERL3|nr:hypothetical protein SERLA73DRAFT_150251 [Serpula lacrymans var. lacrymans S7.3]